jgi:hypothetical protein
MKKIICAALIAAIAFVGYWGFEKYSQKRIQKAVSEANEFANNHAFVAVASFSTTPTGGIHFTFFPLTKTGYREAGNGELRLAIPIALPDRERPVWVRIEKSHPLFQTFADMEVGDYVQFSGWSNLGSDSWTWENHIEPFNITRSK